MELSSKLILLSDDFTIKMCTKNKTFHLQIDINQNDCDKQNDKFVNNLPTFTLIRLML